MCLSQLKHKTRHIYIQSDKTKLMDFKNYSQYMYDVSMFRKWLNCNENRLQYDNGIKGKKYVLIKSWFKTISGF